MRRLLTHLAAPALLALGACATTDVERTTKGESAARKPAFVRTDLLERLARDIDGLLGEPALVRREGVGEFRRYAFEACTLIVILYPDETGALAARRLDAAAKVSGEETPDLDRCLAEGPGPRAG